MEQRPPGTAIKHRLDSVTHRTEKDIGLKRKMNPHFPKGGCVNKFQRKEKWGAYRSSQSTLAGKDTSLQEVGE